MIATNFKLYAASETILLLWRRAARLVPEIMTGMVFFGGSDGINGAVKLGTDDLTAQSMMHYISERVAWYATTFQPLCCQHGYVSHKYL